MAYLGLDFETYGSVDLRKHGLDRYVRDPYFRPLIAHTELLGGAGAGPTLMWQYDFVTDEGARDVFAESIKRFLTERPNNYLCAHNAGFELAVLDWMGIHVDPNQVIDSAVLARAAGGGSRLAAAAPQLLGVEKMEEGVALIKLFSIPGKYQERNNSPAFDPQIIKDYPADWKIFNDYCALDAQLSAQLTDTLIREISPSEIKFNAITMEMNAKGWPVDIAAVEEMQRRYEMNQAAALEEFQSTHDAKDLNLNSLKQLKEWCADRGIKATSFDEKNVAKLLSRIEKKLDDPSFKDEKRIADYTAVEGMLETKQVLGGSSLKKLQVILNTVGDDGRLRDQYVHCGAGQTLRTSGRSVQMQNLKRIGLPVNMDLLFDANTSWSNNAMAENMRQVFTSSHPQGELIVGDFSSVESRGLAWLSKEAWKTASYREGKDLYKVLASKIFNTPYEMISKTQRQVGKVGELSCGYGAGPGAVKEFAQNMGVEMSEGEAAKLVVDWRAANPQIVTFWAELQIMLEQAVQIEHKPTLQLEDGFTLRLAATAAPASLMQQVPSVHKSLRVTILDPHGSVFLNRIFHGVHMRGRNIGYFKPSDNKTGDLWSNSYVDPKTKQRRFYELYGGKLSGILTQSFCRELFFRVLQQVHDTFKNDPQVDLIGQFHDEIVLDWMPGDEACHAVKTKLHSLMTDPGIVKSFPLDAEIKSDYRYTK